MFDQLKARRTIFPLLVLFALGSAPMTAQAATWYASASNSSTPGSGTACTVVAPCPLTYAVGTKVLAGDTIILSPGTYTDVINLNNASKHSNITITTMPAVIAALTFTRGRVSSGTDNRPYFASTQDTVVNIANTVKGATISYLRMRGNTTPQDLGWGSGVVKIAGYPTTIDHSEMWNGGNGVWIAVGREVVIRDSYIHDLGSWGPFPFPNADIGGSIGNHENEGINIQNFEHTSNGGDYAHGIIIQNNTIRDAVGTGIMEASNCYAATPFKYLTMDSNDLYHLFKQGWDAKGTAYVKLSNNNIYEVIYGAISMNAPGDCYSTNPQYGNYPMSHWEVYNNVFHDMDQPVLQVNFQNGNMCDTLQFYNNVIYNTLRAPWYNGPAVRMCGDANSTFIGNTLFNNGTTDTNRAKGGVSDCGSGNNVKNNIFYNNGTVASTSQGADYGNITGDIYQCNQGGTPSNNYIYGRTSVSGNAVVSTCYAAGNCAGFVDISRNNLALLVGSPARKVGLSNLGAPYDRDILGALRISPWDLGAFSFGGLAPPTNLRIIR